MRFMQIESVLQTKNWSEPAKNWVFCSPGVDPEQTVYMFWRHQCHSIV